MTTAILQWLQGLGLGQYADGCEGNDFDVNLLPDLTDQVLKGAVGETMNLASRLRGIAQPGSIVVSERVHRLAGGSFDYQDLGERTLKGIAQPTHAYRIVGVSEAASRFDAATQEGLTPLVGREQERRGAGLACGAGEALGTRASCQSSAVDRHDMRVSVTVWAGEAKRGQRARERGSANAAGESAPAYQLRRWSNTNWGTGAGASSRLASGSGAWSHSGGPRAGATPDQVRGRLQVGWWARPDAPSVHLMSA